MACPFSSGSRLTSPMMAPPLARIGSTSIGAGLVEHQPHRVGAAEQRRGRRRGKGERHAQAVAVAPRLDGGGLLFAPLPTAGAILPASRLRRLRRRGRLPGGSASALPPPRLASALPAARLRGFHRRCVRRRNRRSSLPRALRSRRRRRLVGGGLAISVAAGFRRFRRLPGLDLDPGLLGNHLRGDGRKLRRLLRRHRFLEPPCRGKPARPAAAWPGTDGMRRRGLLLRQRRLFRLLEGDVDHVVLFLAEGMHVDFADQHDVDGGRFQRRSAG